MKEFFINLMLYILTLFVSWNFQNIDVKKHPYLNRYFPNFTNQCNIYFCHCCWTTFLISIFYFKIFQNLLITNKTIQNIITFISKHLDVLFMFHHFKYGRSLYVFTIIGNFKFFKELKVSPMSLLLLEAIFDFTFCFVYSLIFHLLLDPIIKSKIAVDFLNNFDDLLKKNFVINENLAKNQNLENNEDFISDDFEKVSFELV